MTRTRLVLITALLALLFLVGGCFASQTITISNIAMNAGSTGTATITLDNAPKGVSGYNMTLTIGNPGIAQNITLVTYPTGSYIYETRGSTWSKAVSTNPASPPNGELGFTYGYLKDGLDDSTYPSTGATNCLLATVTIQGLAAGTTTLSGTIVKLSDNALGDDFASTTTVVPGTITVYAVPVAGFAASTTTPIVGDTVTFTDQSTGNPTSWAWTFGDGGTSTLQNPTHSYATAGTYTVSLIATNPAGTNTVTKTGYITVTTQPVPVASFTTTSTNSVVGTATASFTDTSSNTPTSWLWEERPADNGAWTTFSTSQNPSFTPTVAGTYDIRLTATNAGGSGSLTKTHVFSAAKASDLLATVGSGDVSGDIYVNSVSPFTITATQAFTLPPTAVGNVTWARLYVDTYSGSYTGQYGLTSVVTLGSTTLGTETMDVWKGFPTGSSDPTYSVKGKYAYPVNDHVIKVMSDYEATYDVTSLITTASPTVTVTNSALSGYSFDGRIKGITLVVAYNDGDSDHVRYMVNHGNDWMGPAGATSSTTFNAAAIPAGWTSASMKTVAHSGTDGTYTLNGAAIIPTSLLSGSYIKYDQFDLTTSLTPAASNTVGFTAVGSSLKMTTAVLKARYVTPPTAAFTMSTSTAAVGQTVTFTDASTIPNTNTPATYAWDFGDGSTSTAQNPTHSFTSAGTYTVKLIVTNEGGSSTATKTLVVTDKPIISVVPIGASTMNPGDTLTYNIVMNNAPNGLAGYDLKVGLGSPSVADISAFSYNTTWAYLTYSPTVPNDIIKLGAVDVYQNVLPGYNNIILATITLRGTVAGSSAIQVTNVNMDDDYGNTIATTTTDGTVTVGSYSGPTAAFTANTTSGTSPLVVKFTDTSSIGSGITTWQWDFNDDGIIDSTDQNPTYTYTANGTYTVKLTVTGPGGSNSAVKENYISVNDNAPVASFTPTNPSGNVPLTVTFASTSTGVINSYKWEYSPDSGTTWYTFAIIANPTKTFTLAGNYLVKLTVTGTGGSSSATTTVTVNTQGPIAAFIANPSSGLAPLTVAFSDQSTGSISSWAWDFGDGSTSTTQNPTHTFAAGTYTVKLTVTGSGGTSYATNTITAGSGLKAAFVGAPVTGVASRNHTFSAVFTDESTGNPTSWLWRFGDGSTSTLRNPTHAYSGRPQAFPVTLTVSDGTSTDSITKTSYITITPYLKPFPSAYDDNGVPTAYYSSVPTDLNSDYVYEDINGNGRLDYDDVVKFYLAMNNGWINANTDVDIENFDYNFNGKIDYDDIITLYDKIIYS